MEDEMAMWSDGGFVEFRRDARMHEHVDTSMIRKMVRCNSNDYITLTFGRIYEIVGVESACRTIHIINDIGDEEKCDVRDFIFEKEKKNIKWVKCIKSRNHKDITIGNKYSVVSTGCGWVEIINDKGIEKTYCDDFFENVPNDELKTIPVREVTWQEVIDEKIPCYFWNIEFDEDNVYVGWLSEVLDEYYDETKYPLRFKGVGLSFNYTAPLQYCKPIDSAIVVVEPKKPKNKHRPFRNFDEVMEAMKVHGQWIVNKNKDYYLFVHTLNFQNERQMNETFKGYQFLDGTPFGVLEEVK